jgi:predicted  nucleic acid-binding Zn-ribbon protein
MAEATQELMYELLKKLQTDMSYVKDNLRDLRQDNVRIRNDIHVVQGDINSLRASDVQIIDRLERIENRLELRELAEAQARFEPHP